jgi:kynurenine formamidase
MTQASTKTTNWGRWGTDDERGALNLITPDAVLAATRVCKTGKVYSLALPIQQSGIPIFEYRGAPKRLTLTSRTDDEMFTQYGAAPGVGANEDVLVIPSHTATHMDALSHVFTDDAIYNGHPNGFSSLAGSPRCGVQTTGSFVGRAVLLDLPTHQGVDWLEPGTTITSADLEACRAAQNVDVGTGDVLLVRTGWLDLFATIENPVDVPFEQPGLGYDAVSFVRDHDVAVVGPTTPRSSASPSTTASSSACTSSSSFGSASPSSSISCSPRWPATAATRPSSPSAPCRSPVRPEAR